MKCTIPEISWHNRDPVLSVDLRPSNNETDKEQSLWRLVTGGADSHVLIWHLTVNETGRAEVEFVADLDRHQKAVNVVRFAPCGDTLASGDDESVIILWKERGESDPPPILGDAIERSKEQWNVWKILRGHLDDVYDISWSPDACFLISGSIDNTAIIWDVQKGRSKDILGEHKGYVQGVSWDPMNQYVCTLSTDRQCRLIDITTKKTIQRVSKAKIPTPPGHPLEGKTVRLFYDDTFQSFFRRLTFSPDGLLVIAPSGIIEPQESTEKLSNATIIFSRHNLKEPIIVLPSLEQSTIAVRCCPVYFQLRENGPTSLLDIPYRIVFAVATQSSVLIYDTQQTSPITMVSNIHYTRLTDITWSSDARILVVSSTDGYCSIVHFQEGELGKVYSPPAGSVIGDKLVQSKKCPIATSETDTKTLDSKKEKIESEIFSTNAMDIDITLKKTESISDALTNADEKINESNVKVADTGTTGVTEAAFEETEDIQLIYEESNAETQQNSSVKKTPPKSAPPILNSVKTPRRVQLITLSSPKSVKKDC